MNKFRKPIIKIVTAVAGIVFGGLILAWVIYLIGPPQSPSVSPTSTPTVSTKKTAFTTNTPTPDTTAIESATPSTSSESCFQKYELKYENETEIGKIKPYTCTLDTDQFIIGDAESYNTIGPCAVFLNNNPKELNFSIDSGKWKTYSTKSEPTPETLLQKQADALVSRKGNYCTNQHQIIWIKNGKVVSSPTAS